MDELYHSKFMKIIKIIIGFILVLIVTLCVIFWTPNTSFVDMRNKYGGPVSQFLEREGGERLHFRDQGLRSGRTIILVHGTSASLHTWEPLVAKLKGHFRLVSLDLPGHGLTGENPVSYTHLTLPTIYSV